MLEVPKKLLERYKTKNKKQMRKNILFNTTRQWNPGDQIIMLGILRLLRHLDFNIFIYNRHPSVWGQGKDNSYKPGKHTLKNIDYYIHAGTPEWTDQKLKPLFDEILERKIPHSLIGVGGSGEEALKTFGSFKRLLETSELLTARDEAAFKTIKQFGGHKLPCPGFLCGKLPTSVRIEKTLIGLVFTTCDTNPNTISPELKAELIEGYKRIIKQYNAIIICHYIDEALEARNHFPDTLICYSYAAKDFENFYDRCDLVISPRLHGALLSAGLGIPTYIVGGYRYHDKVRRLGGTECLLLPVLNTSLPEHFIEAVELIDLKKESQRLINLRYSTENNYMDRFYWNMPSLYDAFELRNQVNSTLANLKKLRG